MVDNDCVFCKIIRGDFNTEFVAESARVVAFADIDPVAPSHFLVSPKEHLVGLRDVDDPTLLAELLSLVQEVARTQGLLDDGYRVVTNDGAAGGQSVWHLHFHVLGGRPMSGKLG
jgi:histidine triad (HIT) family protein